MMKYTIVFVLLHLCYSSGSDTNQNNENLNNEIIRSLTNLTELCKDNKVNFTSLNTVVVPGTYKNPSACVGVYSRKLRDLLNNVTVHDDAKIILKGLTLQLQHLESNQENDNCQMKRNIKKPFPAKNLFLSYKNFFRRLNNRR